MVRKIIIEVQWDTKFYISKNVKSQAHLYSNSRSVNSYPMEGNSALFIKM